MITENLSTLKIHKLTKEQYERELAAGRIDENALYLTPDEGADIDLSSYATVEQLNAKADADHNHSGLYLTEEEIDAKIDAKSDFSGDYNDLINKPTIPSVENLATKEEVNNKSRVQLVVFGEDAEHLPTLNIHKMTQEQYDAEVAAGTIDENAIYLTPDNSTGSGGDYEHPETHPASMITGLASVATSGDYNDLSNKPTIPSIDGLATESYVNTAIDGVTADDLGIYVQDGEPTNAVAGDIWVDTANDPSYIPAALPEITEADNGKVLMVVNGRLQLVSLNLSVDANGVVSI